MSNKKIHFVCKGNVFRSRLAAGYARSLQQQGYDISSSGTHAGLNELHFLSPWARRISNRDHISQWLDDHRTISSQSDFDDNDIVIFMHPRVFNEARTKFKLNEDKCLVWDVKDREDWKQRLTIREKENRTARLIKRHVRQLFYDMQHGGWVDIVDARNKPLHFALPISIANQKKLWHRGCHALITTPSNGVVVQKRSKQIIFSPKLIDITLGGHVDSGENPSTAMLREIHEELGLTIHQKQMRLLEIYKQSRYHPKYKRNAKSFTYTYHVTLPDNEPNFVPQLSEVSRVDILSPSQARKLVAQRRLRGLGKLNYTYAYYRYLLNEVGVL